MFLNFTWTVPTLKKNSKMCVWPYSRSIEVTLHRPSISLSVIGNLNLYVDFIIGEDITNTSHVSYSGRAGVIRQSASTTPYSVSGYTQISCEFYYKWPDYFGFSLEILELVLCPGDSLSFPEFGVHYTANGPDCRKIQPVTLFEYKKDERRHLHFSSNATKTSAFKVRYAGIIKELTFDKLLS